MTLDLPLVGRRILLWFSVFFFGFALSAWFSHFYPAYRALESVRAGGFVFWDVELIWPLMIGLTVFLASGALALAWNVAKRSQPANEESFLVWVGLAVATGYGWQFVLAVAYNRIVTTSAYPLLEILQPAVPMVIGIAMVLIAVYGRLLRKARPPAVPTQDEPSPIH